MRKVLAVAVAALVLTGCASSDDGDGPDPSPSTSGPSTASPSPSSSPSSSVPQAADLLVAPGAVGDARVGMTVDEALATGLFDADVQEQNCGDGTPPSPLGWKPPLDDTFDVYVADGRITSMGVLAEGPKNAEGLGVGSKLADFREVYEAAEMHEAGYGQTGIFVSDGSTWLGFLLDAPLERIDQQAPVTFMEVTGGEGRPSLVRDGC